MELSNEDRMSFLSSHTNLEESIRRLESITDTNQALKLFQCCTKSNESNIFHFILQERNISEEHLKLVTKFLNYLRNRFGNVEIFHALHKKNTLKLTPLEKFICIHEPEIILTIEPSLTQLEKLNKQLDSIESFSNESKEELKGKEEFKMLEAKNEIIHKKNELLKKMQHSDPKMLLVLKYLNSLLQYTFGIRIVARTDTTTVLRLLKSISSNHILDEFYKNHDHILNELYKERIKKIIRKWSPNDAVNPSLYQRHEELLQELSSVPSWINVDRRIIGHSQYETALQHVFQSTDVEKYTSIDKFISHLQEKQFLKQKWIPNTDSMIVYCDYDLTPRHISRVVVTHDSTSSTIQEDSEMQVKTFIEDGHAGNISNSRIKSENILVESHWDGEIIHHAIDSPPNLLWQNVMIYEYDKKQIHLLLKRQKERKLHELKQTQTQKNSKSTKSLFELPKGMTDQEEKKLNSTIAEINKLLEEAKISTEKMKEI